MAASQPARLTIVQYGDYAEAAARFSAGGAETYYAQRYTVDFLAELAGSAGVAAVTVISFSADLPMEAHNGVQTRGVALYPPAGRPRHAALIAAIAASAPTHLVVSAPIAPAIRWGLSQGIPVLPLFADSFRGRGLKARAKHGLLARLLNRPEVAFVANHNLAASYDLARIGVRPDKILPFDWPALTGVGAPEAKSAPRGRFRMLYVGQLTEAKGTADAIRALAILRARGHDAALTLIGAGPDEAALRDLGHREGLGDTLILAGKRPHPEVLAAMRAHDVVLVPSRHAYPEGLPMTLYEALCMRTPLVVSDHPMFALRISHGEAALVHREADPAALADQAERLMTDPALYEALSRRAGAVTQGWLCPLKWDRLIADFLDPHRRAALRRYSLATHDSGAGAGRRGGAPAGIAAPS